MVVKRKRPRLWRWTHAITVATCAECGNDIWPADPILKTIEPAQTGRVRKIYCSDCGALYIASQELGEDGN